MEKSEVRNIADKVRRANPPKIGDDPRQAAILPMVDCELCGMKTFMLGTKRCDSCWELERRIIEQPALAVRILKRIGELA